MNLPEFEFHRNVTQCRALCDTIRRRLESGRLFGHDQVLAALTTATVPTDDATAPDPIRTQTMQHFEFADEVTATKR